MRYLLVATTTGRARELDDVLRDHIRGAETEFFVLVPAAHLEMDLWVSVDPLFVLPPTAEADDGAAISETDKLAQQLLETIVARIGQLGGSAAGQVCEQDPLDAIAATLRASEFEAVILLTRPSVLSRWFKMDLRSRVERLTNMPVLSAAGDDG